MTTEETQLGRTRPQREWWHRHLDPEERRRVMFDLALVHRDDWTLRFSIMLSLAVIVAVMGLLADSAAVVIGAMLLAPLMTPVLGLAAATSMFLPKRMLQSGLRVVLATLGCIAVSALMAALVPNADRVTDEVLSRTSPDLKDLVVALAAGLAGSYATVRTDSSASLPGVAVAVALVPPLGVVGISLEAGRMEQAQGAMLLYVTNLVAIIVIGFGVFIITGFVPPRRLMLTSKRLVSSLVIGTIAVGLVASVLLAATRAATAQAQQNQRLNEAIQSWLGATPDLRVSGFESDLDGQRLSIELSGPVEPPDKETLRPLIEPILGDVLLSVQWIKTSEATTTTTAPTTTLAPTETELLLARITPIVEEWIAGESDGDDEIQGIFLDGRSLRVDVIGPGDPPPVDQLQQLLDQELTDTELELDLTWIRREVVQPGTTVIDPIEIQRDLLGDAVDRFAETNGVSVDALEFDGETLRADLVGDTEPDITPLVIELREAIDDPDLEVLVYFTVRQQLTTTTTTIDG